MRSLFKIITACSLGISLTYACTTILVGKQASSEGRYIVARNADSSDSAAVTLTYHEPREKGYIFQNNIDDDTFTYAMPDNLLGYSGTPLWSRKYREESGFNDLGVGLSGTETIFSNEKTLSVDPYVNSGVSEESLTTIILPQIKTAKEGVLLLGSIIEKYGSYEGFGVAFLDETSISNRSATDLI